MKKILFALILAAVTCSYVFAEDIIKVLSVYSGGVRTSIPLAGIDSLDHSLYDSDSILHPDYTTSIIHAIDRDYDIPIASIDSVVIDKIDLQEYDAQINEISDFINQQTELEVNAFQTNLLSWLNANENIQKATINEAKDFITVKFKNGLEFYIDFQDMSFFNDEEEYNEVKSFQRRSRADDDDFDYYDDGYYNVSEQQGEIIIGSPKVLYIQGMDMPLSGLFDEESKVEDVIESHPVDIEKIPIRNSLLFVDEDFSKYGLIFITQTHGYMADKNNKKVKGPFHIQDNTAEENIPTNETARNGINAQFVTNARALQIYTENNPDYIVKLDAKPVFLINPELIGKKLKCNDAIVYGSYCWSSGLAVNSMNIDGSRPNNTIFGYWTRSSYMKNIKYLIEFFSNMTNGFVYGEAILPLKSYKKSDYVALEFEYVYPYTNHPNSKQRYFSISTDDITEVGKNGQPIISGKINGYDKLKKDSLTYLIYFREGDEEFSPKNAKENECLPLQMPEYHNISDFEIKEDGSFSFEYPGFLKTGTKYEMIFAFEYRNNIYYGETKYIVPEEKDDTITEGDVIDLGLSVKWASCNYGALTPDQLGTKININNISEIYKANPDLFNEDATKGDLCKSVYDIPYKNSFGKLRMPSYEELNELKEKCKWELAVINGTAGARVVGPNNNSIFLPTITSFMETMELGNMYTLNNTSYTSGTYDRNMGWSLMALCISGYYMPQLNLASYLSVVFGNDFDAYIRPVAE